MAADIVLEDEAVRVVDARRVEFVRADRLIRFDLGASAGLVVGSREVRGMISVKSDRGTVSITNGRIGARTLGVNGAQVVEELVVGRAEGEAGVHAGRIVVLDDGGEEMLVIDGSTGEVTIAGLGDLTELLAELAQLKQVREQVAGLQDKVQQALDAQQPTVVKPSSPKPRLRNPFGRG